jgi:hypothetical protein
MAINQFIYRTCWECRKGIQHVWMTVWFFSLVSLANAEPICNHVRTDLIPTNPPYLLPIFVCKEPVNLIDDCSGLGIQKTTVQRYEINRQGAVVLGTRSTVYCAVQTYGREGWSVTANDAKRVLYTAPGYYCDVAIDVNVGDKLCAVAALLQKLENERIAQITSNMTLISDNVSALTQRINLLEQSTVELKAVLSRKTESSEEHTALRRN